MLRVKSVCLQIVVADEAAQGDIFCERAIKRQAAGIQQVVAVDGCVVHEFKTIGRLQDCVRAQPPAPEKNEAVVGAVVETFGVTRRHGRGGIGGAIIALVGERNGGGRGNGKIPADEPARDIFAVKLIVTAGIQEPAEVHAQAESPVFALPCQVAKNCRDVEIEHIQPGGIVIPRVEIIDVHRAGTGDVVVKPLVLVADTRRELATVKVKRRRCKRGLHGADQHIGGLMAVVRQKHVVRIKILLVCGGLNPCPARFHCQNGLRSDVAGLAFVKCGDIGAGHGLRRLLQRAALLDALHLLAGTWHLRKGQHHRSLREKGSSVERVFFAF